MTIILAWAYWQWWFSGTWWWWYWWRFESLTSMLLQPGWCLLCFPTVISCLRQHFYLASNFEQAEEKCNPSIFLKEIKLWPSSSNQRGEYYWCLVISCLKQYCRLAIGLFSTSFLASRFWGAWLKLFSLIVSTILKIWEWWFRVKMIKPNKDVFCHHQHNFRNTRITYKSSFIFLRVRLNLYFLCHFPHHAICKNRNNNCAWRW